MRVAEEEIVARENQEVLRSEKTLTKRLTVDSRPRKDDRVSVKGFVVWAPETL